MKQDDGFIRWSIQVLSSTRILRIVCFAIVLLCLIPVLVHYYLSAYDVSATDILQIDDKLNGLIFNGDGNMAIENLVFRVKELNAIKLSVRNELREMEKSRQTMLFELSTLIKKVEVQRHLVDKGEKQLNEIRTNSASARILALERATMYYEDSKWRKLVVKSFPLPAKKRTKVSTQHKNSNEITCSMGRCFDYSRCSLQSQFPVYFYSPDEHTPPFLIDPDVKKSLMEAFGESTHLAYDGSFACAFVALVNGTGSKVTEYLNSLPYWSGDGRNHLVLQLSPKGGVSVNSAITVGSEHPSIGGAPNYDIVTPPLWYTARLPPRPLTLLVPVRRHYLLSFAGAYKKGDEKDAAIVNILNQMQKTFSPEAGRDGGFKFVFGCGDNADGQWSTCDKQSLEKKSTFSLLLVDNEHISTTELQKRLYHALEHGSIPVILSPRVDILQLLPFAEIVRWRDAVLYFAPDRVSELHIVLMSLKDPDISSMKLAGRHIFQTYFAGAREIVNSLLATLRTRLTIPAIPVRDTTSSSVFNDTFQPLVNTEFIPIDNMDTDENLGPTEKPFDSARFDHNYTTHLKRDKFMEMNPFSLYPSTPFDTEIIGDAQYIGSSLGYRPIGGGAGGSGREFSESLGGDRSREQFTVVILTYERTQVLLAAIARLKSLPYLNSAVVIWNNPEPPPEDIKWPDIGVKVHIIRPPGGRNSLNNRFIPYDVIKTEAILSLDDDAHLRHDEIIFGFRIWREARDRIVGFPGRYHTFDVKHSSFLYDSNYTCEFSMVLTGAAFIHKYYYHQYTNVQPVAIREMVDKFTNCEDLAMNFLVSHITGKPPIKITSRWTFRCPGCPQTLSSDNRHFTERHECMNILRSIYGYLPLRHTQFRADSILFKTRIAHNKQKCFKYV